MSGKDVNKYTKFAKDVLTPMDARLKELAPAVHGSMYRHQLAAREKIHSFNILDDDYLSQVSKLRKLGKDEEVYKEFKFLALNGGKGSDKVMEDFMRMHLGNEAALKYKAFRTLSDDKKFNLMASVRVREH